jgi:membrane associated rhomboid family serine protease
MFFPIRDDQPTFSKPYITYFLIALNLVIYFFQWQLELQNRQAANALVVQLAAVPRREIGLLTGVPVFSPLSAVLSIVISMFLHAGWGHVISNMWMLWLFGDNIEDYLGHFPYLVFYLLSGIAAGFTHILFNATSRVPIVGASGAIAGIMGAYLVLYPRARVLTWIFFIIFVPLPAWIWLVVWALTQFVNATASPQQVSGIAFWAHVGGFVVGILLIKLFPHRRQRVRYGTW